jgi:Xaa-Pro dipeptidase
LVKAVIAQRSIKTPEEVEQIVRALNTSFMMNTFAMKQTKPGLYEKDIYGALEGIALSQGSGVSFPMIFSIRGETLHNEKHENLMKEGDLALLDSGAESPLHYASDITRTFPVNGKFTDKQKDIYNVVLNSQLESINLMNEGIPFRDCHLKAASVIAGGLKDVGLMKGDVNDAVQNGAHALFFPHGLGHMMGLDVHDMEPLGENNVGYNEEFKRSDQFGLAYLRMAKKLEPGFVMTVEPGIYFIPQLISEWKSKNKHAEFINYDKVDEYLDFGGIRIEDDVLITNEGPLVLGKPIPKTIDEVEDTCNS